MHINDPDNIQPGTPTDDPAAAAAAVPAAEAPPPSREEEESAAIAAIDKGIEAADGNAPADDDAAAAVPSKSDEAKPAVEPKSGDKKPAEGESAPKLDTDAQAEADRLGLKGKSNERFVAMAGEIKTFAPIKEQLDEAGIKSPDEVIQLLTRAQAADDFVQVVRDTGANEEQYGATLDYLTVINRASKGDRAAAEQALAMIEREYQELAKALGREVPGKYDPLSEHADLVEKVGAGDIDRAAALELAASRRQATLAQTASQQAAEEMRTEQARAQAQKDGVAALRQWETDKLSDPAYVSMRPELSLEVAQIQQQFPPQQWAAATELAYRALAAQRAAANASSPPVRKPAPSAMRPGVGGTNLAPQKFDTGEAAIEAALESL